MLRWALHILRTQGGEQTEQACTHTPPIPLKILELSSIVTAVEVKFEGPWVMLATTHAVKRTDMMIVWGELPIRQSEES